MPDRRKLYGLRLSADAAGAATIATAAHSIANNDAYV